ncbi:ATP-binding protein [Desulforamulus putei]|uniref:DNA phosphorothioation-dependent restriction protein DptH n=1 Tax=Desulforamulus putei DSM 12395 TaxID=1121429 RepID=A0A1M4TZG5_9FIRM|nr:DUF87 domain-containing protein [Desulforamulus putei]SHE49820.1 DNA phosphorothioation-dependent restriction protein DptH [Desulforamulus putei DSM 12395]
MYFLVKTVLNWLERQLTAVTAEQNKLIFVLPSWDSSLLFYLGRQLTELVARQPRSIRLQYSVACRLGKEWEQGTPAQRSDLEQIRKMNWYNEGDNLTEQRNLLPGSEELLLIVLAGADHITDRHSLQDFYHLDQQALWREALPKSTRPWVEEKFARSLGDEAVVWEELASAVLDYMYERGLADLPGISAYLDGLDLSFASSGQEACRLLLSNLSHFELPALSGLVLKARLKSKRRQDWRKQCGFYFRQAQEFFSYKAFLSPAEREKCLENIQKLLARPDDMESLQVQEWQLGAFAEVEELVQAVAQYIGEPSPELADKLRRVDFVLLCDGILKYKPRAKKLDEDGEGPFEPPKKKTPTRVEGLLPEVFLRAIWLTLRDLKKEWPSVQLEDIDKLSLQSVLFKHEFAPAQDEEEKDTDGRAKTFLQRLLGGIDGWLANSLQVSAGGQELKVDVSLCPAGKAEQHMTYLYHATGQPGLQFSCTFVSKDREEFKREFFWPLPLTHPCRLLVLLLEWAYEHLERAQGLPLFVLPGANGLGRARQEEEACRMLMRALQHEQRQVYDLLAGVGRELNGKPWQEVKALVLQYWRFIVATYERGLFSTLAARGEKAMEYENMAKAYLQALEECMETESAVGKDAALLLLKAFLIVDSTFLKQPDPVWEKDLPAALVTPLHPVMLEMLYYQFSFLLESLCYLMEKVFAGSEDVDLQGATWERMVELAAVRRPLGAVFSQRRLETAGRDFAYLQVLGRGGTDSAGLELLDFVEEEIPEEEESKIELFRRGRLAELIKRVLMDYREMHPYAGDGLSLAVYAGHSLQQIIAGVDGFLRDLLKEREENGLEQYALRITVFASTRSDWAVRCWLKAWQESWHQGADEEEGDHLSRCRLTLHYRMVGEDENYTDLKNMLAQNSFDLVLLSDFFQDSESEFLILPRRLSMPLENYRFFPVLEKVCCRNKSAASGYKRQRVLTNLRFKRGAAHSQLVARLQNLGGKGDRFLLLETRRIGGFQEVLKTAHTCSVWVVCIDPAMDEYVITTLRNDSGNSPDIIGFGTGVGSHGEANFTISTTRFYLSEIQKKLARWVMKLFPGSLTEIQAGQIARALCWRDPEERPYLSGLSLIKSTGPEKFFREFIAGSMVRLLLKRQDEGFFSDVLVSLDAFHHWFAQNDRRPDFLHLRACLVNGRVLVRARLLECKLGGESEEHLLKAREQLRNGLQRLVSRFMPCPPGEKAGVKDRPDQRYWWLQLHRLIASHGVSGEQYNEVLAALELLSEGSFDIEWQAAAFTFWTDRPGDVMQHEVLFEVELPGSNILPVLAFQCGRDFIQRLCLKGERPAELADWPACRFIGRSLQDDAGAVDESAVPASPLPDDGMNAPPAPPGMEADTALTSSGQERKAGTECHPVAGAVDNDQYTDFTTPAVLVAASSDSPAVPGEEVLPAYDQPSVPQRILLGTRAGGQPVYWEYGHPGLPNRHMLIFGASGTGKTYAIQCLLAELGRCGVSSLIVDYTNGFTNAQLDKLFVQYFNPRQHVVRHQPLAINPFRRQRYLMDGIELFDTPGDVAQRITNLFAALFSNLGEQQKATLHSVIREGVQQEGDNFTLARLLEKLEELYATGGTGANYCLSLLNLLRPFVDTNPLGAGSSSWEELFTDLQNRCHVIQLVGFAPDMARLITEFVLLDLYWYYRSCGNEARPRPVVLDEVQNLDHAEGGSLAGMLREGRKFGLSLLLATQTLSNLKQEERDRLFQAAHKLFFRPADTELRSFANIIAHATGERPEDWVDRLANLGRGECYSLGYVWRESDGKLKGNHYVKIKVTALTERLARGDDGVPDVAH